MLYSSKSEFYSSYGFIHTYDSKHILYVRSETWKVNAMVADG